MQTSVEPDVSEWEPQMLGGLSRADAEKLLLAEGYNELPSARPRHVFAIAWQVLREPMILLLIAACAIYLVLGDLREALVLVGSIVFIIGITFSQERKTERALEALRDLSSPRALVIRDGVQRRIPGREVVRGDLVVLTEGDRVPADAILLLAANISVDESLLTGESVPVSKRAAPQVTAMASPSGEDTPFVYASTLVVRGQGVARVQAIGSHTEVGKIGKALGTIGIQESPLQRETRRIVQVVAMIGLALSVLVALVYGATRHDWLHGLLSGVTLAIAILPEEFPLVLTIFLALGAWRLSQQRVLTRRIPAIETLGAATVLCVDKTGTLTLNRMSVQVLYASSKPYDLRAHPDEALPEEFHALVEYSILASQRDPFDPMEKALRRLGERQLANTEHLHDDWRLVREYPLTPAMLALSNVWRSPDGGDYVIAAKGAPEAIMDLCHLDDARKTQLEAETTRMADAGLRVIGVARARFFDPALPGEQHDFDFRFLGLVGLADPVRPGIQAAVRECYGAGIRVVMITGDYPATARSIAAQVGLEPRKEVITGPELDALSDDDLSRRLQTATILARMVPEQKLRVVNALKANGEVVAMTGDGVNDAPALKAAHIGIAMGGRGTDVAREAADLVLLDDDFASLVQAVKQGRRIFDNIKKAMSYLIAIHVPIAGLSLVPVLVKGPLVMLPIHVVFMELIIDPASSVAFEMERESHDAMRRPPRDPRQPLFSGATLLLSTLQGLGVLLALIAVYGVALYNGMSEGETRALTFAGLVIANLGLIFSNRSWSQPIWRRLGAPNAVLWWIALGAVGLLAAALYVPFLQTLFRFSAPSPLALALGLAAGLGSLLWFEAYKLLRARGR